jgi:hypothetical protein
VLTVDDPYRFRRSRDAVPDRSRRVLHRSNIAVFLQRMVDVVVRLSSRVITLERQQAEDQLERGTLERRIGPVGHRGIRQGKGACSNVRDADHEG